MIYINDHSMSGGKSVQWRANVFARTMCHGVIVTLDLTTENMQMSFFAHNVAQLREMHAALGIALDRVQHFDSQESAEKQEDDGDTVDLNAVPPIKPSAAHEAGGASAGG